MINRGTLSVEFMETRKGSLDPVAHTLRKIMAEGGNGKLLLDCNGLKIECNVALQNLELNHDLMQGMGVNATFILLTPHYSIEEP